MNILLLGASGRTGQHVLTEALANHHRVVALVRNANSIPPQNGVSVLVGDMGLR